MLPKIIQTALFSLLSALLWLPCVVSAMVFNPSENLDVHLEGSATFEYDAFTLNEGLTLNYFAPENSVIEIVSQGDIFIGGDLRLSPRSRLVLDSKGGVLTVTGTIYSSDLHFEVKEDNFNFSHEHFENYAESVVTNDGLVLLLPKSYSYSYHPQPNGNIYSGSGSTDGSVQVDISSNLTLVPLPAPVLLFSSALLCLAGFRKKAH